MNTPEVGTTQGGYTFQGGDPADPKSWVKATSDAEQAKKSLASISGQEFAENNLFMQLGANIYKHLTGQHTAGTVELGPEGRKYAEKMWGIAPEVPWYKMPGEIAKRFHENPQTTLVELGKGILYDPELLAVGALRAPSLAARVVQGAAAGGGIAAAQSALKQSLEKDKVSGEEVAGAAAGGAALGGLVGAITRGRIPEPKDNFELGKLTQEKLDQETEIAGQRDNTRPLTDGNIRTPRSTTAPEDVPLYQPTTERATTTPSEPTATPSEIPPMRPTAQSGFADPRLLARMAAVGIGAGAGAYLDSEHPIKGALLGTLGAAALTQTTPAKVANTFKGIWRAAKERRIGPEDTRARIDDLGNAHETTVGVAGKEIWNLQNKIEELVPDAKRRAAITHWIERKRNAELELPEADIKLNPKEQEAANLVSGFYNNMKQAGFDADVLKTARDDYVTHLWEHGTQGKSAIQQAMEKRGGLGMSPRTPFAKERTIDTLALGKQLGLTPKTEDISEIIGHYGNSLARAIANKEMINSLKEAETHGGEKLLIPIDKAPQSYGRINHPQLQGMAVHPDIIPSMQFYFSAHSPGAAVRALEGLNTAVKRSAISFSLFHAKALADAAIGGRGFKAFEGMKGFVGDTQNYLDTVRKFDKAGHLDMAIKGGLKFSLGRSTPSVEDVGGTFYNALSDVQQVLDKAVPGLGKPVAGLTKINHAVDNIMWARLHAGLKLNTWLEKYETILANNAKAHEANPEKVALMSKDKASEIAASFTNDLFGGLNWRRAAEAVRGKWGRDIALSMTNPQMRKGLQILMFAPDWTVSTVRAVTGAFKQGSGMKGLLQPRELADLHRQYILRSAVYYTIVGETLNQALSGHHLWENKDPTRIDLGDGRTMQWSKHTMEPVHWLTMPGQQALNKLGFVPRQILEQAMGVEYLSSKGQMPKMKDSRIGHLLKGVSPIAVQQNFDAGSSAGLAGFFGVPIYGKTQAQRNAESLRNRMAALQKMNEKK